jgi:hypothetical protein
MLEHPPKESRWIPPILQGAVSKSDEYLTVELRSER